MPRKDTYPSLGRLPTPACAHSLVNTPCQLWAPSWFFYLDQISMSSQTASSPLIWKQTMKISPRVVLQVLMGVWSAGRCPAEREEMDHSSRRGFLSACRAGLSILWTPCHGQHKLKLIFKSAHGWGRRGGSLGKAMILFALIAKGHEVAPSVRGRK